MMNCFDYLLLEIFPFGNNARKVTLTFNFFFSLERIIFKYRFTRIDSIIQLLMLKNIWNTISIKIYSYSFPSWLTYIRYTGCYVSRSHFK